MLKNSRGVDVELHAGDLTDQQKVASAMARLVGKTVTYLNFVGGNQQDMPNGFVVDGQDKNIYLDSRSDDGALFVMMHEGVHALPQPIREKLVATIKGLTKTEMRGDFAQEFGYDLNNETEVDNEIAAFMTQAVTKRQDFWQELRTKMGDGDFVEVAKVVLDKLNTFITGAKSQYGDEFLQRYATDAVAVRDAVSTAYADAMKAQGKPVPADVTGQAVTASNRSRIGLDFKDVIKRTPEVQAAAEKVKAGEMTAAEYDQLVNEAKPVEPYKTVPPPATESAIRTALTSDKVDRIGAPSRTLKAGDPVGLRLDIPAYSNHGTWVVSVHEQETGYNAGKSIGYEPVAAATNVTFGVVEKAAMNIAAGKPKATIAVIKGGWKPTTPAEAKLKADQALKSKDWVQVGMDPERHSYFYDRKTMEPVTAADEVIQIGPLVLAKNPTYGEKSGFMFGNRVQESRAADVNPLGMYSELARKIDAGPGQAMPDQWRGYIRGLTTKGVKPDEIEWSGVEDFISLKGGKVSKQEVADYLKQGGVKVEETVLGETGEDDTKYGDYTLPGVENYREVLLTLPVASDKMTSQEINARIQALDKAMDYADGKEWDEMQAERLALKQRWQDSKQYEFRSNHWDQPNVLAHIRLNDRTDADGNKVLFVEEIQSDWGQEGKKKGFKTKDSIRPVSRKEFDSFVDSMLDDYIARGVASGEDREQVTRRGINMLMPEMAAEVGRGEEYARMRAGRDMDMNGTEPAIPAAPFVTKTEGWLNLALKRVMVMAAEGGYEKVAFVNGKQSAERYDLSKQIDRIDAKRKPNGMYELDFATKDGNDFNRDLNESELEANVGKEMAKKIVDATRETGKRVRFSGLDLKVGGEGMKTFYDTIVPTALKKLLPKVGGGQMSEATIVLNDNIRSRVAPADAGGVEDDGRGFWLGSKGKAWENQTGFDVTDAMREKVATSGLPMFSNKLSDQATEPATQDATQAPERKSRRGTEAVGDFDVRTMKDGTALVYGDPQQIRALIPDDVKGRVTKDGIVFTNAAAPRVKAALSGRKTAYSRGGQVTEKLPMKDGKYLGAPEKYNTPGKIVALRKQLRKLTVEGERGRYWYENSSRAVLDMVGGNVQEARKFVALLAIYSPQAKVDANSTFALRAWAQYRAGQPISVKTGVMDAKAQAALDDVDAFWSGEKTGNFFFNLLREIDPSTAGKQGATIDMWMMRAAEYDSDAPTATQYSFMENETNRIAQEMGWEPQQVQAAIWVAMKARMENSGVKKRTEATSEKKGWIRFDYPLKNGKPIKTRVILNAQAHRDNWLKHAFQHVPSKADTEQAKFDFSDGVRRHIGQISWEARPGRSTGVLPGVNDAPYDQQVEFQQAVQKALLDDDGVDLLAYKLGLLVDGPDILAPGIWQGEVAAGMQKQVAMAPAKGEDGKTSLDPAQKVALDAYSATLGLLLRQEGVGYHRPFYKGTVKGANGVDISVGRTFTPQEAQALWGAINERMNAAGVANWEDAAGMISSPTGIRVVNFGALPDNVKFHDLVEDAASTLAINELSTGLFSSDGDLITNDWKSNPNGQSYQERITAAGSPDLLGWTRDVLAPRVQAVFDEFSSRYGWGDPGRIQFSNRAGSDETGGGRDRGVGAPELQESVTPSYGTTREGAATAVGYHYSKQPSTSLSSSMYGTGLRGAEMARLEGADPRLKQRVYFYVDRGTGINPEAGVGGQAHRVNLENLYDVDEDTLRLRRDNNSFNDFESAVIDAGFDGYLTRDAGPSGNAVLLGQHDVPVEQLGGRSRIQTGQPMAPARARELDDIEKISANKMLPAGQMSGKKWATLISRGMPEVYERLANSPVWQSDEVMYRGDLAKQLRASLPKPEFQRDPAVAKLFRDLESSRGLGRVRAMEAVDAHPMGATIRQIDADFLDILQGLDDSGLVKINCK